MPIKVVENGVEAMDAVKQFRMEGYNHDNIYVMSHSEERSSQLAEATNAKQIGIQEEGTLNSLSNMFRSRGEELKSQMKSIGLTQTEANRYEEELDHGRILVIAQ